MKLQVAFLAIAALGVAYGDGTLSSLWREGAESVAPPVTESYMSGDELKASVIRSYELYLDDLDAELTRQYRMSTIETVINSATIIVDINSRLQLVWGGVAAPNEFDYDLLSLTNIYNELIELVSYGKGVVTSSKSVVLKNRILAQLGGSTDHELADYFYHFHDEVLKDNFNKLGSWLSNTMKEGEKKVLSQADSIEKKNRDLYLWPMIEQVRADTYSIQEYNVYIQQYSTPSVWKQYTTTRDNFLNMEINF